MRGLLRWPRGVHGPRRHLGGRKDDRIPPQPRRHRRLRLRHQRHPGAGGPDPGEEPRLRRFRDGVSVLLLGAVRQHRQEPRVHRRDYAAGGVPRGPRHGDGCPRRGGGGRRPPGHHPGGVRTYGGHRGQPHGLQRGQPGGGGRHGSGAQRAHGARLRRRRGHQRRAYGPLPGVDGGPGDERLPLLIPRRDPPRGSRVPFLQDLLLRHVRPSWDSSEVS
mmetsp:Transcript_2672/g.9064  ORF Transcript_2672/g.9064 Transcript_2672/m.9064 type:complete len:218 (-) Transcript_2672:42-695(-)